jgi:hypothetical protein
LGESHFTSPSFFCQMKLATDTPNTASGETMLTVAGTQHPVKFDLKVMRDWSKLTGKAPSEFGQLLADDYLEALTGLLTVAVRRYVTGNEKFSQDDAADLMQDMTPDEAELVGQAIANATMVVNPLLAALSKQVTAKTQALQPTPNASGSSTSISA